MTETAANEQERRLLRAVAGMVDQYLSMNDGTLDHLCISAGERALALLLEYGLVTDDSRSARWTEAGQRFLEIR